MSCCSVTSYSLLALWFWANAFRMANRLMYYSKSHRFCAHSDWSRYGQRVYTIREAIQLSLDGSEYFGGVSTRCLRQVSCDICSHLKWNLHSDLFLNSYFPHENIFTSWINFTFLFTTSIHKCHAYAKNFHVSGYDKNSIWRAHGFVIKRQIALAIPLYTMHSNWIDAMNSLKFETL